MVNSKKRAAADNIMKGIDVRASDDQDVFRVRFRYKGIPYTATRDTSQEAIQWRDETKEKLRAETPLDNSIPQGDIHLVKATGKFILGVTASRARASINSYNWAEKQLIKYFGEKTLLSSITQSRMYEYVAHRQNIDGVGPSKISQELS